MSQGTLDHHHRLGRDHLEPQHLDRLRHELEEQAQVFEDPGAYLAGVEDVFQALDVSPSTVRVVDPEELPPPGGWFG